MFERIYNGTVAWAKQPFDEHGSVINWFLFFGLLLAIGWLWSQVIKRIT